MRRLMRRLPTPMIGARGRHVGRPASSQYLSDPANGDDSVTPSALNVAPGWRSCASAHSARTRKPVMIGPDLTVKSKRKLLFNAQAFLDSAGIAKKIVKFSRGDKVFSQGDPCEQRHVHPGGRREALGALEGGPGGGRGDARARRLLRRRVPGGSGGPDGDRDRRHRQHRPARGQGRDGQPAAHAARLLGPLHRPHAGAEHPDRRRPDRPALQLEREAARADAAAARPVRQARQAGAGNPGRSPRRRWRRWSGRPDRASTSS